MERGDTPLARFIVQSKSTRLGSAPLTWCSAISRKDLTLAPVRIAWRVCVCLVFVLCLSYLGFAFSNGVFFKTESFQVEVFEVEVFEVDVF